MTVYIPIYTDDSGRSREFGGADTIPRANIPVMVGDSGAGGQQGSVPAPPAGSAAAHKFLKANGTFESIVLADSPTITTPTINVGSDATGDLYYRSANGVLARLPAGPAGATLKSNGAGSVPSWELPASNLMLLHFEGSGTSFVDSVSAGRSLLSNNNATQSTSQVKFGAKSLDLSASGSYLSMQYTSEFNLVGDYTFDCWFLAPVIDETRRALFNTGGVVHNGVGAMVWRGDGANNRMYYFGSSNGTSWNVLQADNGHVNNVNRGMINIQAGVWNHFAFVKSGSYYFTFINGNADFSLYNTDNINVSNATNFFIGALISGYLYQFGGFVDEARFIKQAVWTTSFTPPTSAY